MSYNSDLVRDSQLDTRFHSKSVSHKHYDASLRPGERPVLRVEVWKRERFIGGGTYGKVWLENCSKGGRSHTSRAVKEIGHARNARERVNFSRELEAMVKFSHQKYVRCFVESFGWYENADTLFIAMEYFPQGDLQKYLSISPPVPEPQAQQISFQLVEGLAFMHENGFAHRDLKPSNILVKSQPPEPWWVKIGDFGISKRAEDGAAFSSTLKGTLAYMAPELHGFVGALDCFSSDAQAASRASDMWSLGEIVFQILTKEPSFRNMATVYAFVQQPNLFPGDTLRQHQVSDLGVTLIQDLMKPQPNQRMRVEDALVHAWTNSWRSSSPKPPSVVSVESSDGSDEILDPSLAVASDPSGRWSTVSYDEMPSVTSDSYSVSESSTSIRSASQFEQHEGLSRLIGSTQAMNSLSDRSAPSQPANITISDAEPRVLRDEAMEHTVRSNRDTGTFDKPQMHTQLFRTSQKPLTHNDSETTKQPRNAPTPRGHLRDGLIHDAPASAQTPPMARSMDTVTHASGFSVPYLSDSIPQVYTSLSRTSTHSSCELSPVIEDRRFRTDIVKEDSHAIEETIRLSNGQHEVNTDWTSDFDKTAERPEPSATLQCLYSAHRAKDPTQISYPHDVAAPDVHLNASAPADRRFRYNRDFLLQFRDVFKEKPLNWDSRLRIIFNESGGSPRINPTVRLPIIMRKPLDRPLHLSSDHLSVVSGSSFMVDTLNDHSKHSRNNPISFYSSERQERGISNKSSNETSPANGSATFQDSRIGNGVFTGGERPIEGIPQRRLSSKDDDKQSWAALPLTTDADSAHYPSLSNTRAQDFEKPVAEEGNEFVVRKDGSGQVENKAGEVVGAVDQRDCIKFQGLPVTLEGRVLSWQGKVLGLAHLYERVVIKEVEPYLGHLVLDIPQTDDFLRGMVAAKPIDTHELTHLRYSAVTGTPWSFERQTHVLRPSLFAQPRRIRLVLAVNSDVLPPASELVLFLGNLFDAKAHLQLESPIFNWKSVAVVVVLRELDDQVIKLFADFGLPIRWPKEGNERICVRYRSQESKTYEYFDDGQECPLRFRGEAVTARIYEYTTVVTFRSQSTPGVVPSLVRKGVPAQLILCRVEPTSIAGTEPWLGAITQKLQPRLCIRYALDKQTPRITTSSILHTWRAKVPSVGEPMKTVFHKSSEFDEVKPRK